MLKLDPTELRNGHVREKRPRRPHHHRPNLCAHGSSPGKTPGDHRAVQKALL
jgi:hypothetical protein